MKAEVTHQQLKYIFRMLLYSTVTLCARGIHSLENTNSFTKCRTLLIQTDFKYNADTDVIENHKLGV